MTACSCPPDRPRVRFAHLSFGKAREDLLVKLRFANAADSILEGVIVRIVYSQQKEQERLRSQIWLPDGLRRRERPPVLAGTNHCLRSISRARIAPGPLRRVQAAQSPPRPGGSRARSATAVRLVTTSRQAGLDQPLAPGSALSAPDSQSGRCRWPAGVHQSHQAERRAAHRRPSARVPAGQALSGEIPDGVLNLGLQVSVEGYFAQLDTNRQEIAGRQASGQDSRRARTFRSQAGQARSAD